MSFSGIYNYRLFKNGADFLTTKVIYYILDDKYEIHLYNNNDDLKEDNTEYLITFYDTNRAYFKGYQELIVIFSFFTKIKQLNKMILNIFITL